MEYTLAFDQLAALVLLGFALGGATFLLLAYRARGANRCRLCLRDPHQCRTCAHNPHPRPVTRPALTWDPIAHEVHEARRERED